MLSLPNLDTTVTTKWSPVDKSKILQPMNPNKHHNRIHNSIRRIEKYMSSDRKPEIKILLRNTKQIYDYVGTQIKNGQWMSITIRHYYDSTLLQNYVKSTEFASPYDREDNPLVCYEKRNTPVIIISKSPT